MINNYSAQRFVQLTPFQETLTYNSRTITDGVATDSYTAITLPRCRARDANKKELALNPELLSAPSRVFEIWSPIMQAVNMSFPQMDDYVTDAYGNSWTVFNILGEFNDNVWTLFCVRRV